MYQQDSRTKIQESLQTEIQTPQFLRKFNRFKKAHRKFRQFTTLQELIEVCQDGNLCNQWLHLLVSYYQNKPKRKGWLMTLLLVISWKQMEHTFYRFGYEALNQINSFDSFAPVYESYIEAFLCVPLKTKRRKHTPKSPLNRGDYYRFTLRIKDRAEYLIKQELKECGYFKEYPEQEVPASENLPWQFEIEQLIEEWQINGVLSKRQANLVIDHLIYEFTFLEISKRQRVSPGTVSKRFQRALRTLTPYLRRKYFSEDGKFLGF